MKKGIIIIVMTFAVSLIGLIKVNALTLTQDVTLIDSPYINFTNTNDMTCEWDKCFVEIQSTTTNQINSYNYTIQNTLTNADYVEIPFTVSQPIQVNTSNTTSSTIYANEYCSRWTCGVLNPNTNVCSRYDCAVVTAVSSNNEIIDKEYIEYQTSLTNMNFTAMITYTNNTFSYCELDNNMIICPTFGDRIPKEIIIQTNFKTARQTTALFNINRSWKLYKRDKSNQDIINNQNQNTQEILNQNATYSDEPKEETEGKNETSDYEQKEQQLMGSLDFNMTAMDNISINPNASAFVWQIADRVRSINPAIILLMTSVLGMGLIKLILNR